MKKILRLTFILIISFFLSGCWDYSSLENNYTIVGIGIDVDESSPDNIIVSFVGPTQAMRNNSSDSGSNSEKDNYYFIKSSGESIRSATTKAQNKTGQTLSINNLRVIVLSEDIARKGISKYLDSFLRNAQINLNIFIFVTKGTAQELISYKSENISRTPLYLIDLLNSSDFQTKTDFSTLKEVTYALNSNYKAFVLPYLTLNPKEKEITFENLCLFKDNKMIDILSEGESIGYFLLSGFFKKDEYVLDGAHTDNKEKEGSSFYLFSKKRTTNVSMVNDMINFDLMFKLTGKTTEQITNSTMMSSIASDDTNKFKSLQKKYENKISSLLKVSMVNLLEKLQTEYKVDSLGFGEYVRVKYPDYFKEISWEEEFQKAKFNVNVEVNIKSRGIIK